MGHYGNRSHREIVTWKMCHLGKSSLQKGRHFPIHFCSDSFSKWSITNSTTCRSDPFSKCPILKWLISEGENFPRWLLYIKLSWLKIFLKKVRMPQKIEKYQEFFSWNLECTCSWAWSEHDLRKNAGLISYRMMTSSHATSWWFPGAFCFLNLNPDNIIRHLRGLKDA